MLINSHFTKLHATGFPLHTHFSSWNFSPSFFHCLLFVSSSSPALQFIFSFSLHFHLQQFFHLIYKFYTSIYTKCPYFIFFLFIPHCWHPSSNTTSFVSPLFLLFRSPSPSFHFSQLRFLPSTPSFHPPLSLSTMTDHLASSRHFNGFITDYGTMGNQEQWLVDYAVLLLQYNHNAGVAFPWETPSSVDELFVSAGYEQSIDLSSCTPIQLSLRFTFEKNSSFQKWYLILKNYIWS